MSLDEKCCRLTRAVRSRRRSHSNPRFLRKTSCSGINALYNGNIAETQWLTNSDQVLRTYGYRYDNLNRLKEGIYKKVDNNNVTMLNAYNESMTYDKNGNIKHLNRFGSLTDTAPTQMDNLTYDYKNNHNSNQLAKVSDAVANNLNFKDEFKDSASNTIDDFVYDDNGNLTKDNNKKITNITYNHLNLPTKITFGSTGNIEYIYNAAGQKLEKIVTQGTAVTSTNYLGGYQYLKPNLGTWALQFFPTPEGYVEPSGSSYKYVYQYKDHLGNVRLSYDKNLNIQEESNYYPFGLKHNGYNNYVTSTNPAQKYKFQGQELQDELGLGWYSYKWRNYDPAIARFMSIDPLTEEYEDYTPYQFSSNQPVHAKELEGLESSNDLNKKDKKTPMQRAYNPKTGNTDLAVLVIESISDIVQSVNTYVNTTDKDITTTVTSKDGGGENQKSKGKKLGDNINGDAFLDAANASGVSPSKIAKSFKGGADLINNIVGLTAIGVDTKDKITEVVKENTNNKEKESNSSKPSEFVRVKYDEKTGNQTWIRKEDYESQQKARK